MKYCTVAKSTGRSRPIWTSVVCARVACSPWPVWSIPVAIFLPSWCAECCANDTFFTSFRAPSFWFLNINVLIFCCNSFKIVSGGRGSNFVAVHRQNVDQISYLFLYVMLLERNGFLKKISKWLVTPTFFSKNVFSWTCSSGRVKKIRMLMFKIPDFSLAPRLCKQAGLDFISARKDFDPRTLVSGDLRHFDTTVRCAAHYAGATLKCMNHSSQKLAKLHVL